MHVDPYKVGLTFGMLLGGLHVLWSALVLLQWAQPLVNFSMWAHMAHFDLTVGPFDPTAAVTVIVIATLIGCGIGYALATIWNKVHQR